MHLLLRVKRCILLTCLPDSLCPLWDIRQQESLFIYPYGVPHPTWVLAHWPQHDSLNGLVYWYSWLEIDTLYLIQYLPVLTYVCFVSVFSRTVVSQWNWNEKGLKDGTQSVWGTTKNSNNCYCYICISKYALWLVNVAGRTLLHGQLKFNLMFVAKLLRDLSQNFPNLYSM